MKQYNRTTRSNGTASTQLQAIEGEMMENGHSVLTSDNGKQLAGGSNRAGEIIDIYDGETFIGLARTRDDGSWTLSNVLLPVKREHSLTAAKSEVTSTAFKFNTVQTVSGREDFNDAPVQNLVLNQPLQLQSGLTLTLLISEGKGGLYTQIYLFSENDKKLLIVESSRVRLTLPGTSRKIDFTVYLLHNYLATITYFNQNNEPITTNALPYSPAAESAVSYTPPAHINVSAFEIQGSPELGGDQGFHIDNISWQS